MKTKIFTTCFVMAMLSIQMADAQHEDYLVFDATNPESYAEAGVLDQLNYGAFTVEFWVNIQEFTGNDYMVCNEGWDDVSFEQGFVFRTSQGGDQMAPRFAIGTSAGWEGLDGPDNLALDTWTHIAAVVDGQQVTLYVDGVVVNTATLSGIPTVSQQTLTFGEGSMWKDRRMTGFLSDCRIWNVARTQQEIADNKDAYLTTAGADLLANWKIDEGSGTTIADFAANYPGTLQSGVAWGTVTSIGDDVNSSEKITAVFSPSNQELYINNFENESAEIKVYSTAGQSLFNGFIGANSRKEISVSGLPAGIYIVVFDFGSKQVPVKFIKN
jgi:hypothetical protein